MNNRKREIGDILLCYSSYHVEKARITALDKGIITLDNQLKVDRDLNILNTRNPDIHIEEMDYDKYRYLRARSMMDKVLYRINSKYRKLGVEDTVRVYEKLSRIAEKYF